MNLSQFRNLIKLASKVLSEAKSRDDVMLMFSPRDAARAAAKVGETPRVKALKTWKDAYAFIHELNKDPKQGERIAGNFNKLKKEILKPEANNSKGYPKGTVILYTTAGTGNAGDVTIETPQGLAKHIIASPDYKTLEAKPGSKATREFSQFVKVTKVVLAVGE